MPCPPDDPARRASMRIRYPRQLVSARDTALLGRIEAVCGEAQVDSPPLAYIAISRGSQSRGTPPRTPPWASGVHVIEERLVEVPKAASVGRVVSASGHGTRRAHAGEEGGGGGTEPGAMPRAARRTQHRHLGTGRRYADVPSSWRRDVCAISAGHSNSPRLSPSGSTLRRFVEVPGAAAAAVVCNVGSSPSAALVAAAVVAATAAAPSTRTAVGPRSDGDEAGSATCACFEDSSQSLPVQPGWQSQEYPPFHTMHAPPLRQGEVSVEFSVSPPLRVTHGRPRPRTAGTAPRGAATSKGRGAPSHPWFEAWKPVTTSTSMATLGPQP